MKCKHCFNNEVNKPRRKYCSETCLLFSQWKYVKESQYNKDRSIYKLKLSPMNDSDILQKLHDNGIIFCLSSVDDGSILWLLTDTRNKEWDALQWYSSNVSLAIWDMSVEASIYFPESEFTTYFKTLQC